MRKKFFLPFIVVWRGTLADFYLIETISLLIQQLRPKQWTKNLLVFAAYIFSIEKVGTGAITNSILAFVLFSLVSSCVYIINDYVDREADRQHPEKCHRPMASGQLNPTLALALGIVLLIGSLTAAYLQNSLFSIILCVYFLINVAYSFKLKHLVLLDIMTIAVGFMLRALGGGIVINVNFTPWFLLCVFLLSLLLATGKRRHELMLLEQNKGSHRKVLEHYSEDLLNQMTGILTTATVMSYSMFTFLSGRTTYLMYTIPLVIYGIFRYLYLIHIKGKGGKPEELLFQDPCILITVVLYGVSVIIILKVFG